MHLVCPSMWCRGLFIAPLGRWLQQGVLVGERDPDWGAWRCDCISRCGRPCDSPPMDLDGPDH
jgi:hypothetical protein